MPDLPAFRHTLVDWLIAANPADAPNTCVLLPTRAAAEQLRRTVEGRALAPSHALLWPLLLTRRDLYDDLAARLCPIPRVLSAIEREVMLAAAARRVAEGGIPPPYTLRPGLIAETLALYDHVRRLGRTLADLDRNFRLHLQGEYEQDLGAAKLLQQTDFLVAALGSYEHARDASGGLDEHSLRFRLQREPAARPLCRVIVTLSDRLTDSDGLWPADFDLLTRLPLLRDIEVLCTESSLAAGALERLHAALPDFEEVRVQTRPSSTPVLVVPLTSVQTSPPPLAFTHRDREEELLAVARRLKQDRRDGTAAPLQRTALVVKRPLPYLSLARSVFADAAIAFDVHDTLPLAAEPYAAAVQLVLTAATADFSRVALLALLRSPHFALLPEVTATALNACDAALASARYLGGVDRLALLAERSAADRPPASRMERRLQTAAPALRVLADLAGELSSLTTVQPLGKQIDLLLRWLLRHQRPLPGSDGATARQRRSRAAIHAVLADTAAAFHTHDPDASGEAELVTVTLRRRLEERTFSTAEGSDGLLVCDAQAARYADLDDVQVLGLVEGDWPGRERRNVLYPAALLALLEPSPADPGTHEREARRRTRAAFRDLLGSAANTVRLSTFALEHDALVEPSSLIEEVREWGLMTRQQAVQPARVLFSEALTSEPRLVAAVAPATAAWGRLRLQHDERAAEARHGQAGHWQLPRVSISRLELYLSCPFRFFAREVLRLEEPPEDTAIRTPLERGIFLHDVWERFFAEWQQLGHGRIDHDLVETATAVFTDVCEMALTELSPVEAALERLRLCGSAVDPGIAHRVFAMEAERPAPILNRLLELPLAGDFRFATATGDLRLVSLSAKADRIDVLAGGELRVIDYKSKTTPDVRQALQLPIYAHLAQEVLQREALQPLTVREALYLSFEGDRSVVTLQRKENTLSETMLDAQARAVTALDGIAAGVFPVQPSKRSTCGTCAYRAVCRLEYVTGASGAVGVTGA